MILVYHNITPPRFFLDARSPIVEQCFSGRRELGAYARRCDLALGDSVFNQSELDALGFPRTGVLPVVPDFSHLDVTPRGWLARQFDDDATNILFVGPASFRTSASRISSGSSTPTAAATTGHHGSCSSAPTTCSTTTATALAELVQRLGTPDVHLIGHVSNEEF